jgi:nucleotide-binding universal stress UspA family protein
VFHRILIAFDASTGGRDALVLGRQLVDAGGEVLVAAVLSGQPTPLNGGPGAVARRRAGLLDAGQEAYAALGSDVSAEYVTLSGVPFGLAVAAQARRIDAEAVVIGQDCFDPDRCDEDLHELLGPEAPCVAAIAPYGHRFVTSFEPERIGVLAAGSPHLERLSGLTAAVPSVAELTAQTRRLDMLIVPTSASGGHGAGRPGRSWWSRALHDAACPVLVVPAVAPSLTCTPMP